MVRTKIIGMLAALSLALGCGGGQGSSDGAGEEELVLRSYAAPGRAKDLQRALGRMLTLGERRVGSVQVGPDDQLLVLAPRSVHEGLADLIEAQSDAGDAATPSSVAMTYWFVAARTAEKDADRADVLKEVKPILDEIVGVQGPQAFLLIERLELRQAGGGISYATTPKVKIMQDVSVSDENFVGWVETDFVGPNRIRTTIKLRADQFLVLGQLALDKNIDPFYSRAGPPRGRDVVRARPAETTLLVILRAETDQHS